MMKRTFIFVMAALTTFGGHDMVTPAIGAEVTVKALTALPKNRYTNKPFWVFLEDVNANGKGVLQLKYIGGPEAVPVREQMGALARGIFDLFFGPASYFGGRVPETTAVNASNMTAMELRRNGALKLLSKAYNKRANAEYLGYFGSGYSLALYLTNPPKMTADGQVAVKGLKIRGSTVFLPFMRSLGINMISIPVPQMYTALERGVVEGAGWTTIIGAAGWGKFLKYRVRPFFYQGDMGIAMNLKSFQSLPKGARDYLMKMVVKHEALAHEWYAKAQEDESKRLRSVGVKDVVMKGKVAQKFLKTAYDSLWASMQSRLSKAEVDALRGKFFKK